MSVRNNREKTFTDTAEEILARYGLELPDEMKEPDPVAYPPERDYEFGNQRSPVLSYLSRHPEYRRPKKEIEKEIDTSPLIAPSMTAQRFINEKLLPQIKWLKKNSEDLAERFDALEAKASECENPGCKARGTLHLHQTQGV